MRDKKNVLPSMSKGHWDSMPESLKLYKIAPKSQEIGLFIDWLREEKKFAICFLTDTQYEHGEYFPIRIKLENLLAEYFKIDLKKVEQEQQKLLDTFKN